MENRRQTYRHAFESREILRADLHRPGQRAVLSGDVLDLSLGGLRIRLRQVVGTLGIGDSLVTRLLGRDAPTPAKLNLTLPSQVVSLLRSGDEWHCGLRFLPIADSRAHEDIERTLSRFLLDEQRRRRRKDAG